MGAFWIESQANMSELDTRKIATVDKPIADHPGGTLPPQTVLQERYEILHLQAIGGMGAVYQARDLRFSAVRKIVAVKEINNTAPDPRLQQLSIQNFEREANILASLSHPAIPKIFDFFSDGDRSYLIIEFVEGQSLEDLIEARGQPFDQEEVVDWGLQICDVLAHLHHQKPPVIFRDIKPGNLMLKPSGTIAVIDFGIAKSFEHGQRGTMIGTEGYSPPEQYRGVAEPRGDLYALGATLHHLLSGRDPRLEPPFTFHERPIHLFNSNVSPDLEKAINTALAYDIEERFESAADMARALNDALPRGRLGTVNLSASDFPSTPKAQYQAIQPKWTFKCEDEVRSSPRIVGPTLFIGSYDSNLYALKAADGSFVWKFPTDGGIASTPCISEDTVLIGSEDGSMYALDRHSGQLRWSCPTNHPIRSSATIEYGHVFFGSDDGCLYNVNLQSGRIAWQFQSAAQIRSTPLAAGDQIFVGSDDGYIYSIDMRTGSIRWKYNTHRRVTSSPTFREGMVYIGSADGHVYAVNGSSGWPIWRFRTKGHVLSSPTIAGDSVYVGSADGNLYSIDAQTGRQRWQFEIGAPVISSPAANEQLVFVGSGDGSLYAVDAKNGREIWKYVTGGPVPSSPIIASETVYVGSTDHNVYAFVI
jgi:outer membrane protein assembly factor BamB/tRNA A-37 threonylcarbamoyl transferase component Bud32